MRGAWFLVFVAGVLTLVIVCTAAALFSGEPRGRGEEWLSWSSEQRNVFVDAYVGGYTSGKIDACYAAAELFESRTPITDLNQTAEARCLRHAKSYSNTIEHYVSVITEFYEQHAEYRNIPYAYLIGLLTDDRYKTADEVYRAALKGDIRTRF